MLARWHGAGGVMVGAKRNVSWFNNAAKQQSGGEEDKKGYCVRAVSKIMGV
jgi:hypothetical protein